MSATEIAALVAAVSFAVLVLLLAYPLVKLARGLDEARTLLREAAAPPAVTPAQIAPVITLASGSREVVERESRLASPDGSAPAAPRAHRGGEQTGSVVAETLGPSLIKAAAFGHGVRRALAPEHREAATRRYRATLAVQQAESRRIRRKHARARAQERTAADRIERRAVRETRAPEPDLTDFSQVHPTRRGGVR